MQTGDPSNAFRQPGSAEYLPVLGLELHVVVVLGPVVANQQSQLCFPFQNKDMCLRPAFERTIAT